jgi:hypothetical protein
LKIARSRELPACEACVTRNKAALCSYGERSLVNWGETSLQVPTWCIKWIVKSEPLEQSSTDIVGQVPGGCEPPKDMPEKSDMGFGHVNSVPDVPRIFNHVPLEKKEIPKTSAIFPSRNTDKKTPHRDLHYYRIDRLRQDTKPFSESHLQVMFSFPSIV